MTTISRRFSLSRWAQKNPVVLKEMRSQMRGMRALIIITVYLLIMTGVVGLVYLGLASSSSTASSSNVTQVAGKAVFATVVGIEMMMVCFIAPALTAGAIASERERQTYDLLRTTLLPARSLVAGKLASAISFLIILLFVGFPVQSLAFMLGGVSTEEVLIAFLMLVTTALFFSAIGLFISSLMKTTLISTVVSYVTAILLVYGIPILIGITLGFFSSLTSRISSLLQAQQVFLEILIISVGYLFIAVNPLATAITSELILAQSQSLFYMTLPLSNGWKYPIVSPWIAFIVIYALISLVLVWGSITRVRQAER